MQLSLSEILRLINGHTAHSSDATIHTLSKIEEAKAGSLTFLANPKYQSYLYTTQATAAIVSEGFVPEGIHSTILIYVPNAYAAFSVLLNAFQNAKMPEKGIEQPSFIHPTAKIGANCYIGAFSYIGPNAEIADNCYIFPNSYIGVNSKIGSGSIIYAGVKLYADTIVGKNVIIQSGCVIGGDGFGFAPLPDGTYHKIAQIGNVIIADNVEIGANTAIDCATMGSTIIGEGVKLDNLIQIAHNVEIGKHTVIASQTGVSGSAKIGDNCIIGGQAGIVGHISIANGSLINAKSGISKSIKEPNLKWNGTPATNFTESLRSQAVIKKLPEIDRKIEELERMLNELKAAAELSN